jgi:hypothetical protein
MDPSVKTMQLSLLLNLSSGSFILSEEKLSEDSNELELEYSSVSMSVDRTSISVGDDEFEIKEDVFEETREVEAAHEILFSEFWTFTFLTISPVSSPGEPSFFSI